MYFFEADSYSWSINFNIQKTSASETFYFAIKKAYNKGMKSEIYQGGPTSNSAEAYTKSLATFPKHDARLRFPAHPNPDENLDWEAKKEFYMGDFIKHHFSGRSMGLIEEEAHVMRGALPFWKRLKMENTKDEGNHEVIGSINLEIIETAASSIQAEYLSVVNKIRFKYSEGYNVQYHYWGRINKIAKRAIEQENERISAEIGKSLSPTKSRG